MDNPPKGALPLSGGQRQPRLKPEPKPWQKFIGGLFVALILFGIILPIIVWLVLRAWSLVLG